MAPPASVPPASVPPVSATRGPLLIAIAADVVLVLLFALVGRRSHAEAAWSLPGLAHTAWPFLAGLALGWARLLMVQRRGRRLDPRRPVVGLLLAACTVGCGMILRAVTGQGVALSFIAVALLVNVATMVGWRFVLSRTARG